MEIPLCPWMGVLPKTRAQKGDSWTSYFSCMRNDSAGKVSLSYRGKEHQGLLQSVSKSIPLEAQGHVKSSWAQGELLASGSQEQRDSSAQEQLLCTAQQGWGHCLKGTRVAERRKGDVKGGGGC